MRGNTVIFAKEESISYAQVNVIPEIWTSPFGGKPAGSERLKHLAAELSYVCNIWAKFSLFLLWIWKSTYLFLCFGSWNVFLNVRNPFSFTICHLVFLTLLSLEISQVCRLLISKISAARKGSGYLKLSHRSWQILNSE